MRNVFRRFVIPRLLASAHFLVGRRAVALHVEARAQVFEHFTPAAAVTIGRAIVTAGSAMFGGSEKM